MVQDASACLVGLTFMGMAILLFCLSLMRLISPAHPAKLLAPACLFLSVGLGLVGLSVYVAGKTWHLPNSKKPLILTLTSGAVGIVITLIGCSLLVGLNGKSSSGKQPAESVQDQEQEGAWPPPPTIL